jgi:hypothetical protein
MAEDTTRPALEDVKKHGATSPAGGASALGALRQAVRGLGELLGGVAEASAEGFRGFNAKLASGATSATMTEDVIDGLAEGNARFLEGVAKASREAYDRMKAPGERRPAPEAIDYERLARLVAIELRKTEKDRA